METHRCPVGGISSQGATEVPNNVHRNQSCRLRVRYALPTFLGMLHFQVAESVSSIDRSTPLAPHYII